MSSTVAATSTSTASSSDGGIDMQQNGANYFFGFLIAFVVLLLVVVGCGIGSRRRILAGRQAELMRNLEPWASLKPGVDYDSPIFYEKPLASPVVEVKWEDTMPLSAAILRQGKDPGDVWKSVHPYMTDSDTPEHNLLPSWLPGVEPKRKRQPIKFEPEPPESLQIAVVITMPTKSDHLPVPVSPEYQIGVANIPWDTELSSTVGIRDAVIPSSSFFS